MSIQSKRRLLALSTADKKNQIQQFLKEVAINKTKINKDSKWLRERLDIIFEQDQNLKKQQINQINFYVYGGSILKL